MGFAKVIVVAAWMFAVASMMVPSAAGAAWYGRCLFWFLLVAHALECLVFLPVLRRAPGGLAGHLVQTMVFGVFHVRSLRA